MLHGPKDENTQIIHARHKNSVVRLQPDILVNAAPVKQGIDVYRNDLLVTDQTRSARVGSFRQTLTRPKRLDDVHVGCHVHDARPFDLTKQVQRTAERLLQLNDDPRIEEVLFVLLLEAGL